MKKKGEEEKIFKTVFIKELVKKEKGKGDAPCADNLDLVEVGRDERTEGIDQAGHDACR
jgi:hypothetical protein